MAKAPPRPGAVRSVAQLLVVIVGGTAIGALLVLLAFPDATPARAPILLAGAGLLAVLTALAAHRLGRTPTPARRPAGGKTTKSKTAKKESAAKKKSAGRKKPAAKKKSAAKKPPARRKAANKSSTPRGKPGQGRARR